MIGRNALGLVDFIRYMDIIFVCVLGGLIVYSALLWRRWKKFESSRLALVLAISLLAGVCMGGFDYTRGRLLSLQRSGSLTFGSNGQVRQGDINFNAYWDAPGTLLVNAVNWGTLMPGQTGNATFYIKNGGDFPIYCEVTTASWQPVNASQFMSLTWSFGESPLGIGRSRKVTLQLKVSPTIKNVNDFNFNIVIYASDEPFTG